jgi:methyl-accepting chemotaxis protein
MSVLNRLTIKAKLAVLFAMATIALAATVALSASVLHQRMIDDRVQMLRSMVDTVHGLATVLEGEVQKGQLTREQALDRLRMYIHGMRYDKGDGYFTSSSFAGISVIHGANPKQEGEKRLGVKDQNGFAITDEQIKIAKSPAGEGIVNYYYPRPGMTEQVPKVMFVKAFNPWEMTIGTGAYLDDIEANYHSVLVRLGLLTLAILGALAIVAFFVSRNITGALGSLKSKMERLAAGELSLDISEASRVDEVGAMGKTVQVFKDNATAMRKLESEQAELTQKAERDKRKTLGDLADNFEARVRGIVDILSRAATQMQQAARSLSSTADGTRQKSLAVASGANEATSNVQTVAAAAEELSASITEIGRQVTQAATVSRQAADEGERTNTSVSGLSDAVQKIGEVMKLINDIASQTNLLALNATIEAARAGDAGKGFAVVANEVKSLATQTAKATNDIRDQIGAIQAETQSAVSAIQGISKTILEVNQISSTIAAAVEEQTAATQEITRNVQQAANGTQEVSANIESVSKAADEAGTAAAAVLTAADELAGQSDALRREVDHFLSTVRAA